MAGIPYYSIVGCCPSSGTALSYFNFPTGEGLPTEDGVYRYTGPQITINGITFNTSACYTITFKGSVLGAFPVAPSINNFQLTINCEDVKCECEKVRTCYTLYPCDNTSTPINTQNINVAPYVGEFVSLYRYPGCWYVTLNESGVCEDPIDVEVDGDTPCTCAAKCYLITGAPDVVTYVNIDGDLVTTSGSTKVCSLIYPIVSGGSSSGVIYESGTCSTGQCDDACFTLTDCNDDTNILESNTQSLLSYIGLDSVIKINGYDTCWKVDFKTTCECLILNFVTEGFGPQSIELNVIATFDGRNVYSDIDGIFFLWWNAEANEWLIGSGTYGPDTDEVLNESIGLDFDCPESVASQWNNDAFLKLYIESINPCLAPCECPIPVTVLQSFTTCEACLPVIAYKFVSCLNPSIIKYSVDDFSAYVGDVVKLDCGDCWIVEQIDFIPPSIQNIVILSSFDSCLTCSRKYYKLTDCNDNTNITITYSNLLQYVGQVVKIENCTECWTVTETTEFLNATTVVVTSSHPECIDCLIPTTCECTKLTNLNTTEKKYGYYDCNNTFHEVTLQPGESTEKVCSIFWLLEPPYCTCIQFKLERKSYYAFIIPDEFINGKPVYGLCDDYDIDDCGTIYWDGTNWVIADPGGTVTWILLSSTSGDCPYGEWTRAIKPPKPGVAEAKEKAPAILTSQPCDIEVCPCIQVTIGNAAPIYFYPAYIDINGYPVYFDDDGNVIFYEEKPGCWVAKIDILGFAYTLCGDQLGCPVGTWTPEQPSSLTVISELCPTPSNEFTVYDYFEKFGECKNGVCPPPVFKNNRTVRPGYNTPICSPAKYDEITCRFADILYKIALEKRYGITNCCPEEDDRWLVQKELIDLQALKDPNYNCPDCICSCHSGNTCSTCNCKN